MGVPIKAADDQASSDRSSEAPRRWDAIDFWRGFILCTIFVNHVPGNIFERLTFRNFGFSDSSEAFVFISGLSLALAYGRRYMAGGDGVVMVKLGRRAVKLYAIHIAISLAGVAIFAFGALVTANADLMAQHGRDLMVHHPAEAMIGLVSLGHQFGYFNILPLYILLVGLAPVQFWLARRSLLLMLTVSLGLYAASRAFGWNVPSWPMRGTWFFDPFAWQLLMAVGLAVGLTMRNGMPAPRRSLAVVAGVVVVFSAISTTDAFSLWPGLNDAVRAWVDVDKTSLGLGRLFHFLSLAYLLYAVGVTRLLRHIVGYAQLCLIGRHGLLIFALLSLMAAGGQVVVDTLGHTVMVDCAVILAGFAALYGAARFMERGADKAQAVVALP